MDTNRTGKKLNHRDRKNPRAHELWMESKRANRLKQIYVVDPAFTSGQMHYVKVARG